MKPEAWNWAPYASRRGAPPGRAPRTTSEPATAGSRPTKVRSRVDFPEPLVPTSASELCDGTTR